MRASEIRSGNSYAVVGKGIARAKVKVLIRKQRHGSGAYFDCEIEEGLVYTGWTKNSDGHLDTDYVGPPERVLLTPRDFIRPWSDELDRRVERDTERGYIADVLTEMDGVLNDLGLSSAYMQMVQTPNGPIAVAVLGIEELMTIKERVNDDPES